MCGIVGVVTSHRCDLASITAAMNDTLIHRGPDDAGMEVLPDDGAAIAMRRLSILDVQGGHQPMWNRDRDHVTVFNGEIYNHAELRAELINRGYRFTSHHSDTEVIVHGFDEWGTDVFARLNGMFAIAIWSRSTQQFVLARDRMGEKPLYIARTGEGFAFASELKALFAHPRVKRSVDPHALEQYLSLGYVVAPRTMVSGISKLEAGHYALLTLESISPRRYWQLAFSSPSKQGPRELTAALDGLLDASVRARMVADVPVGVFLSGGLDSSTVAYYMRRHSDNVHSFSIGFEDPEFDESRYAELTARHLGTTHHLEVFSDATARELVPTVADILDEPMPDSSILPTYLLSRFARGSVKVALGGDGSDELLMGYRTYKALKLAWTCDRLPQHVRGGLSLLARRSPTKLGPLSRKARKLATMMDRPAPERLTMFLSSFGGDARWLLSEQVRASLSDDIFEGIDGVLSQAVRAVHPGNATIAAYARGYLQEDILVKVDRASMAVSLEVRSPFLDVDLVEFLSTVPPAMKLHGMTGKYLLRKLMTDRLPVEILHRRKMGFGVPMNRWLSSSLAPLLRDYLAPARIAKAGIFDQHAVAGLLADQEVGNTQLGQQLWFLLLFEMWRDRWGIHDASASSLEEPQYLSG